MRRIALPLSIVASLAVLDACSGGQLGTGLSNTTSTTASINAIVFQNGSNGPQANLFVLTELGKATPTPTPTPTPVGQTPTPAPTAGPPTPTPTPTPKPTPTPVFVVVSPAPPVAVVPGSGNRAANPLIITAIGEKSGGGVLGAVAVPSVTFQWAASYTPEGTIFNYTAGGGTITCGAPPPGTSGSGLYPIQIDVPFAATVNNPTPANGDTIDPFGDGFYAIASLNANNQTVNSYNTIAFFAPLYTNSGKTYCITFTATGGGATGAVYVVVKT